MKYEITARRIREAMNDINITQQELSEKSHVGKSSISHYVNGTHAPGNKTAYYLANVLNVNPAWLMGLDVPKKTEEGEKNLAEFMGWEDSPALKLAYQIIKDKEVENFYNRLLKADIDIATNEDQMKVIQALKLYFAYESASKEVKTTIETILKNTVQQYEKEDFT